MEFNCPVCNKAGLADFRKEHLKCPQCDSDLMPYMLIEEISKEKSKKLNFPFIFLILSSVIVLAILLVYTSINNSLIKSKNQESIAILLDSLSLKQDKLDSLKYQIPTKAIQYEAVEIIYYVKKGDCLTEIASRFYNDWHLYTKIESDNGLKSPYLLQIGQPLKIKLNLN